ncbi:hypothetical protein KFK09_024508 [Dendrobium nobile]|uniref:Uncharacterized protein n=1 Tax=Dendrobium nobile TaxID=94219 RepID=A0A8T3AE93_DENNO|nr:hypothetical protein KFK09_024508 [Dendrobium nobile]
MSWNVRRFNCPVKVQACKELVCSYKLEMVCILEAKISQSVASDPWFIQFHAIFDNEGSFNNFDVSSPGRMWLKWNASTLSFQPSFYSCQMVHGSLIYGPNSSCFISVVYASNSYEDRLLLWHQIKDVVQNALGPGLIMDDFNSCRSNFD